VSGKIVTDVLKKRMAFFFGIKQSKNLDAKLLPDTEYLNLR
jgi:hypothetical protein